MTTIKTYRTALISICFFFSTAVLAEIVPLDKVVAIVNSSVLTQNQLDEAIEGLKQQSQAMGQPIPDMAVLKKKALDRAIGELLQLQVAQRANLKVSDADVTRAISQIAQQNHLSVEQLKEALQRQGMSYPKYRTQLHDQILIQQVQQKALAGKVHVSNAEVQAYLKKVPVSDNEQAGYHLEDLLIPLPDVALSEEVAAATQKAQDLLKEARAGKSFSDLAQGTVQQKDLEWRSSKELPEIFVDAVQDLKPGDITNVIRAPNGLHILRLIDARAFTPSITEAQARQRVLQQKVQEQADLWSLELRKSAYIKIM